MPPKQQPKEIHLPHNFTPRIYQAPFLNAMQVEGYKRGVLIQHRRSGKDKLCLNYMITESWLRVGLYAYFFPSYKQGRKALWMGMDKSGFRFMDHFPAEIVANSNDTEMRKILINGSIFQIFGTDDIDSFMSANPVGCVFAEFSLQNPAAWNFVRPILRENDGWAVFNFTYRGRNHAYKLGEMARRNKKWFFQILTVNDTKLPDGSPVITEQDIQDERDEGMSEAMIQQEYYCSPDAALDTCFFGDTLARHTYTENGIRGDLVEKDGQIYFILNPKGILEIWDLPYNKKSDWDGLYWGKRYAIGSDISYGVKRDYSVAYVYDRHTNEFVVRMRSNKIDETFWADLLQRLSLFYDKAIITPERNGPGITTCRRLVELKANVYFNIIPAKAGSAPSKTVGWVESKESKNNLCGDLKEYFKSTPGRVMDSLLLAECSTFVIKENEKIEADSDFNDDCLKPGTLIRTVNGYIPIEDIVVGDLVLTHKNRYKKVLCCIEKDFNGDWYDLKFKGQLPLGLSYNHPIYAASLKTFYINKKKITKPVQRCWLLPGEWKRTFRCISIINNLDDNKNTILKQDQFYANSRHGNPKLKEIKLDKSFAKFLGLFLAEGHAGRLHSKDYVCSLAFNKNSIDLINEIREYVNSLGVKTQDRIYDNNSNAFAINFSSQFLHYLLTKCYDKNREKIMPDYANLLGTDLKYTLEYWLKGDGCLINGVNTGATTSKSLALTMRDLAFSCGKYATIQLCKRHRYEVLSKDQFWVNVHEHRPGTAHQRRLSDYEYGSRISGSQWKYTPNIKKTTFSGKVYNLQVEEDESFIADGIVVHNCVISAGLALQGSFIIRETPKSSGHTELEDRRKKEITDKLDSVSQAANKEYEDLIERLQQEDVWH